MILIVFLVFNVVVGLFVKIIDGFVYNVLVIVICCFWLFEIFEGNLLSNEVSFNCDISCW